MKSGSTICLTEEKMSDYMLHIVGATRMNNCSAIVGDRAALLSLRAALDDALATGSGGAALYSSDGEPHAIAVALVADMYPVYTTYAGERNPSRSRRETVPIAKLQNYAAALAKATELQPALA
jgi:hypothetical protein